MSKVPSPPPGFRFDPFADVRMGKSLFQMRAEDWLVEDRQAGDAPRRGRVMTTDPNAPAALVDEICALINRPVQLCGSMLAADTKAYEMLPSFLTTITTLTAEVALLEAELAKAREVVQIADETLEQVLDDMRDGGDRCTLALCSGLLEAAGNLCGGVGGKGCPHLRD